MTLGPLFRADSTEEKPAGWGVYIYDSSGQQVIGLTHDSHVLTELSLRNKNGVDCTTLWPSRLWLSNDADESLISIGAFETGGEVYVSESESKGQGRAILTTCETALHGGGKVLLRNSKGRDCVSLDTSTEGVGNIDTYDDDGNLLVHIGTTKDGEAAIATFNRAGKVKDIWPY